MAKAVRNLRNAFGENQQQFADRIDTAVRTVARYESNQTPPAPVLIKLWRLARLKRLDVVAEAFTRAVHEQIADILENPSFAQELSNYIAEELHDKIGQGFIAEDVTEEERSFLIAALSLLRSSGERERGLLMDALTDKEAFERTLKRAALLQELEERLKEDGESRAGSTRERGSQ